MRGQKTKNLPDAKNSDGSPKSCEVRVLVNRGAIVLVGPRTVTGLLLFCQAEMMSTGVLLFLSDRNVSLSSGGACRITVSGLAPGASPDAAGF